MSRAAQAGWVLRLLAVACCSALVQGCGGSSDAAEGEAAPDFRPPASLHYDTQEPLGLKTIERVPADVTRIVAAGVEPPAPFSVARHRDDVASDCRQCHQSAVRRPDPSAELRTRSSHVDITLNHGQAASLDCQSCHLYDDLGSLRGLDDRRIDFAHAYQSCAQCHFEQARDWAGGAHGKRLGGWRGERVVLNCTGCHDPHAPAFEPRLPVAFPTITTSPH